MLGNVPTGVENFVEIRLKDPQDFLKVRETLTRIGVPSRKENTLWQSCHILHKRGRYYLVHFKELFALDGAPTDFDENDIARRNTIACLLEEWDLVSIVNSDQVYTPRAPIGQIKILSFAEKSKWVLKAKYQIGRRYDK